MAAVTLLIDIGFDPPRLLHIDAEGRRTVLGKFEDKEASEIFMADIAQLVADADALPAEAV
jgi:hypothetical protein